MDSGAFTETLEAVDADVAAALYGVDAADITDCAVYTSLSAGAEEIAVLVMANETSATAAMDGLEKRVADRRPPWRATSPTRWPSWTAPSLEQRGSSVLLAVCADADAARAAIDGLSA